MNRIDFDRAFPQTPDCVGEAIRLGFLRGARLSARRRRVGAMLSVAAALVILLGAALGADGQLFRHDVLFPVLHIGGKGDAAVLWFRAAFHFPLEQQSLFIQPFLLCPGHLKREAF